ncbi:hypothetical protein NIES37_54790 [Tolypothrix tenuis PCC 7101]|uniref:Uncharacterized protein n=1 Tax=Tolypothrix tenuis PCC 7101 TaxID=231146 RepID=A0A1Z4N6Z8_9CYAN|nr:hypothetical protein NIES37_54790 [Tolypothrix tenuis PCC 7101]BAZ74600.1 hypothetical protein NIES50_31760 [Aulosira laxa NIES-50]
MGIGKAEEAEEAEEAGEKYLLPITHYHSCPMPNAPLPT